MHYYHHLFLLILLLFLLRLPLTGYVDRDATEFQNVEVFRQSRGLGLNLLWLLHRAARRFDRR